MRIKCPHCTKEMDVYVTAVQETIEKPPILEDVKCPECDGPMVSRKGQFGTFWGCKKYPDCRGTRDSMGLSKAEREAERDARTGKNFGYVK